MHITHAKKKTNATIKQTMQSKFPRTRDNNHWEKPIDEYINEHTKHTKHTEHTENKKRTGKGWMKFNLGSKELACPLLPPQVRSLLAMISPKGSFCRVKENKHCQRHNGPRILSLYYLFDWIRFVFISATEIIQVIDSILWVRCASGNVLSYRLNTLGPLCLWQCFENKLY